MVNEYKDALEKLHKDLTLLLCSKNVYIQPPSNIKLQYPCIIIERLSEDKKYADDIVYALMRQYKLTLISLRIAEDIADQLAILPYSNFDRVFISDGLYHYVYNIYI